MGTKISALTAAADPDGTELVPVDQGGVTLRMTTAQIAALVPTPTIDSATFILKVTDPNGSALTTGDGKAYFTVPATINGFNLVSCSAKGTAASSSGAPAFQIANVTDSVDMLSTKITIDAGELSSLTAATPAVIDTAHDDVATDDTLRIDCDVAGTGFKGLDVILYFERP